MLEILNDHWSVFLSGLAMTIEVSTIGILIGCLLGFVLAAGLASPSAWISRPCRFYRSAIRGTPILVQLLIIFYVPTTLGYKIDPFLAAVIGLGANSAAFQAEIFRACTLAIPRGQIEAADMLGFSSAKIWLLVKIPQVMRLSMPPLVNELGIVVKNSSLVSIIAVTELIRRGQQVASSTYQPLETYAILAVMYILLNLVLSRGGRALEARLSASGKE